MTLNNLPQSRMIQPWMRTNQLLQLNVRKRWLNVSNHHQNSNPKREPKLVNLLNKIHRLAFDLSLDQNLPPLSDDLTLDVNKWTSLVKRKKKMAKWKQSPSKFKSKKRTKASESPQQDSHIGIWYEFGSQPTPSIQSSEVPFGVSISHTHTHGEPAHNVPYIPKNMVKVLNIVPWTPLRYTHKSFRKSLSVLHKNTQGHLSLILSFPKMEQSILFWKPQPFWYLVQVKDDRVYFTKMLD